MCTLNVNPAALNSAAKALSAAASAIIDEIWRLNTAVALQLSWEGEAQCAFELAQSRLGARLRGHSEQLACIAGQLIKLAENYGAADRNAARGIGGQ